MADFSEVNESECLQGKMPAGCRINPSHTFVLQSVINEIKAHGRSSLDTEVCGVLLGNLKFDGEPYLLVDGRIEGRYATHQSGSVTFTSETWDFINSERDSKYPDKKIVGWYHTHPGFGIFLSDMDAFIHNNFFSFKWQPAYVFDPQAETDGFFFSTGDSLGQEDVVIVPDQPAVVIESKTEGGSGKSVVLTDEDESLQSTHRFSTLILSSALLVLFAVSGLGYLIINDKLVSTREKSAKQAQVVKNLTVELDKVKTEYTDVSEQLKKSRKETAAILADAENERNIHQQTLSKKDAKIRTQEKRIEDGEARVKTLEAENSKLRDRLKETDPESESDPHWYNFLKFW